MLYSQKYSENRVEKKNILVNILCFNISREIIVYHYYISAAKFTKNVISLPFHWDKETVLVWGENSSSVMTLVWTPLREDLKKFVKEKERMQESEITSHNYNSQLVHALLLVNLVGHNSLYGPLNSKVYLNWNLPSLFEPTNIIIISLTLYTLTSVSHQQQFFSELHTPGRSHYTNYWYSWVQTIYFISEHVIRRTVLYTFPRCWQGEFVCQSKGSFQKVTISFILMTLMCDSGVIL